MATFESLPTELQIQIWQLTFNEPRIIELGATPSWLLHRGRATEPIDVIQRMKLTTNNTTLMHPAICTNRLSRELALAHYGTLEKAQFDPATDILYFGPEFSFTQGWEPWTSIAASSADIRNFAFHLHTFRRRNDFFRMREVCELRPEGVTFVLEAPFTPDGPFANAMPGRFMAIDYQMIAGRKDLKEIGKTFREAQVTVIQRAYENCHSSFGTWGRRWIEGWDREIGEDGDGDEAGESSEYGPWKMPRIKFLVEDQLQAEAARERRRRQKEFDREREAAERKRARLVAELNAPPIDWSTPEMSDYEEYLHLIESS